MKKLFYISALTLFFSFFISCKKDKVITTPGAKLTFSQDSVLFDTVFTSIGSTTKLFRVHNPNNGNVNISSIRLARGNASYYRLNVDGVAGKSFSNIEIDAKDSLYIFVEVTIDPTNQNNPFIYRDSILFDLNGSEQHFDLIAFGQNAYYHMPKLVTSSGLEFDTLHVPVNGTDTWLNDKPHLIYGYVVVDSTQKLIIPQNTHIYVHNGGGIWVYRGGSIQINGTHGNEVTFQGDRLEQEYKDVPGQWDRIWINEGGTGNLINYAIIKNAFIGVHAGVGAFDGVGNTIYSGLAANLTLNNTIIQNCSYAGILGHDYNITGGDNVVVNCGQHILEFDYGGSYSFYQCTFANYWNQTNNSQASNARTTPSFLFNNYYNGSTQNAFDSLYFGNCILDGSMAEEFQFDTLSQSGGFAHPYLFDHCLLKTQLFQPNGAHTSVSIINNPPGSNNPPSFVDPSTYNFKLNSNSAAIDGGSTSASGGYANDINGTLFSTNNSNGQPDIGAYAH
ncbi:MAG TPA: hypothetical protein VKG26_13270 [Bacteroidia bacterium]|nr:hypothetical protein [Bacteroidia bacterium]